MNKAIAYVVTAIILGLVMTLVPTWLFLVKEGQQEKLEEVFAHFSSEGLRPPFLDYSEQNHVEAISHREVEILGVSFVVASIVYILFKRKTPRHDYIWSPIRPY